MPPWWLIRLATSGLFLVRGGFGQKLGQPIDEAKIERRFKAAGSADTTLVTIKSVSPLTLEATSAAIKLIEAESPIRFDNFQYLALADHIDFVILHVWRVTHRQEQWLERLFIL